MTATLAPSGRSPIVRVRPAPPLEPPFDDERPLDAWPACVGQLELRPETPPKGRSRRGGDGAAMAATAVPAPGPGTAGTGTAGSGAGGRGASSELQLAVERYLRTCVEILNGYRPMEHLRPLTDAAEYVAIAERLTRWRARLQSAGRAGAGRSGGPGRGSSGSVSRGRPHICEPRTGVAEAAVVLGQGARSFAVAARFEHRGGHWYCTLLQVI